jgi:hypothetical protein
VLGKPKGTLQKSKFDQHLVRFEGRTPPSPIRFVSMAATYGNSVRASNGVRKAITEAFGGDLLESHRVMQRNQGMIGDADLILVMDKKLRSGLPRKKHIY